MLELLSATEYLNKIWNVRNVGLFEDNFFIIFFTMEKPLSIFGFNFFPCVIRIKIAYSPNTILG